MMASTGFGDFARLPYDIREQIWFDIAYPRRKSDKLRSLDEYLGIIRASRSLHEEIEFALFGGCVLELELSPLMLFTFSRENAPGGRFRGLGYAVFMQTTMHYVLDTYSRHGLGEFPFHILERVEIRILIPRPGDIITKFTLWSLIPEIVGLLKGAQFLRQLVFSIQEDQKHDQGNASDDLDYRFFLRAFCQLRKIATSIEVWPRDAAFTNAIDWESLVWVFGANLKLERESEQSAAINGQPASDNELQRQLARDWYRICLEAGHPNRNPGDALDTFTCIFHLIFPLWSCRKPSGQFEFEERFDWILDNCPEIIWDLDQWVSLLTKVRHVLEYKYCVTPELAWDTTLPELCEAIADATVKYWKLSQKPNAGSSTRSMMYQPS
ncbi:uncharacterized protein BJX67DRAFT_269204 [Aspergillus lucknowensis]|uniref:Uncharacterized protein n=1 Tax=Aspergillus lucknowensis TaxID=176173 RepID=A0ABR4LEU5_9EURO